MFDGTGSESINRLSQDNLPEVLVVYRKDSLSRSEFVEKGTIDEAIIDILFLKASQDTI